MKPATRTDEPGVQQKPKHDPGSDYSRVLRYLQRRRTATNGELNHLTIRFGARIHELRRDGFIIKTIRVHDGVFRYEYVGHRDG